MRWVGWLDCIKNHSICVCARAKPFNNLEFRGPCGSASSFAVLGFDNNSGVSTTSHSCYYNLLCKNDLILFLVNVEKPGDVANR